MKKDGSLLCYAVTGDKDAQVHAALASNIWSSYGDGVSDPPFHQIELNSFMHRPRTALIMPKYLPPNFPPTSPDLPNAE